MSKGQKPVYIARCKQHADSEYMFDIGAAWPWKKGNGYVIKIYATPIGWDGEFILAPPSEKSE